MHTLRASSVSNGRLATALLLALAGASACASSARAPRYPTAEREAVVEDYHGTAVADPYRWLEDTDSARTRAWIEAENALAQAHLDALPARAAVRARLEQLWSYERFGLPVLRGERAFYTHNDGLEAQSSLYVADGLEAAPRMLIDANALAADGKAALAQWVPSEDGARVAYAVSEGGSDWITWRVREVASGRDLPDQLRWAKFGGAQWRPDGLGFYYQRYDEPEAAALRARNAHPRVCLHRLGQAQALDQELYRIDDPDKGLAFRLSSDGDWLLLTPWDSATRNTELLALSTRETGARPRPLATGFSARIAALDAQDGRFFATTDEGAPNGRIVSYSLDAPNQAQSVVPEQPEALDFASLAGGRLIATYLRDAAHRTRLFELDGRAAGQLDLPGLASLSGFQGRPRDERVAFALTSFTQPAQIWLLEPRSGAARVWRSPKLTFDPAAFSSEQVFVHSRDGTRVPMFLVHRRDLRKDGAVPTYLYGYGGFDVSLTPSFSAANLAWIERGGLLAIPNLRGGGEYGERWHEAGTKLHKQNVFDDFIASAEWLIANGWTRSARLAIGGASNGGLLVGACMTQRPELFGACLPAVGVMDMLRFQKFTIGYAWISDYGTSDDPEQFRALLAYSPYHNIRPGTRYPPTLITTGDHDDRVVPGHSFKFAAALQQAQAGDAPCLIRIETRAGHGAGKPTSLQIDEAADRWAFLLDALGVPAG